MDPLNEIIKLIKSNNNNIDNNNIISLHDLIGKLHSNYGLRVLFSVYSSPDKKNVNNNT